MKCVLCYISILALYVYMTSCNEFVTWAVRYFIISELSGKLLSSVPFIFKQ